MTNKPGHQRRLSAYFVRHLLSRRVPRGWIDTPLGWRRIKARAVVVEGRWNVRSQHVRRREVAQRRLDAKSVGVRIGGRLEHVVDPFLTRRPTSADRKSFETDGVTAEENGVAAVVQLPSLVAVLAAAAQRLRQAAALHLLDVSFRPPRAHSHRIVDRRPREDKQRRLIRGGGRRRPLICSRQTMIDSRLDTEPPRAGAELKQKRQQRQYRNEHERQKRRFESSQSSNGNTDAVHDLVIDDGRSFSITSIPEVRNLCCG